MNLGDRMNQLADDVDTSLMPGAGEIRRLGDGYRHRSHQRAGLAAVAAGVVAIASVAAFVSGGHRSDPEPVQRIGDLQVTRTLSIPNAGSMLYADGFLWVVNENGRTLTPDGSLPTGDLSQVDPGSGEVLDRIPHTVGGWPSAGGGALWLCTAAGGLNQLTRVDLESHEVTRTLTAHPASLPHGSALARGTLWVADTGNGDLLRVDPETSRVLSRTHIGSDTKGESPALPVYDRNTVWVSTADGEVVGVDPVTGKVASRLQLPMREVQIQTEQGHVLYAVSGNDLYEVNVRDHHRARVGRELILDYPNRSIVQTMTSAFGELWAVQMDPDRLLQIDPVTFKVTARMPLTGIDHKSFSPVSLAAGGGALWIRTHDRVLELTPSTTS